LIIWLNNIFPFPSVFCRIAGYCLFKISSYLYQHQLTSLTYFTQVMRLIYSLLAVVSLILSCPQATAQTKALPVGSFLNPGQFIREQLPIEKLYIHTDKPAYSTGDTIWFKGYLLNADYLTYSQRSGLLYLELDDMANKCVKRIMTPIDHGVSWGNIAIEPDMVPDGTYTLRAYTNWMLNFGDDFIFKQQITISSVNNQPRLISTRIKKTKLAAKDSIQATLSFTDINKEPIRLQDMQFRVVDGKHTLYRGKGSTSIEGVLNFNFALPGQNRNAYIIARETAKKGTEVTADLIIPINANRPENTDLQFMPEGGNLIAGLPAHTAFKALGEDGNSTNIEGRIINSKQAIITNFKALHKGMGSFDFTPQAGEIYTAEVTLPDGLKKIYPLPAVTASGISLKAAPFSQDSLEVTLAATPDIVSKGDSYYLLGQSRDAFYYGALIVFKHAEVKKHISRNVFPSGITRFTLLTAARQPLNERMIYIDHHDQLKLNISTDRPVYTPHDSIALNLQVTDQEGQPVRGTFSMAVTDNNQVKTDSLGGNIVNQLLLTSDLKGNIEDPNYYFTHTDAESATALDNLLLTQGWVGYSWKQIYNSNIQPTFQAEQQFMVQGKVTNIFNKPVAKAGIVLLSKKPSMVLDTITGTDGRFAFKGFYPVDSTSFVIQARNKNGKSFNVGVDVDEFKPPVFTQTAPITTPWYVNTDTTAMRNLNNTEAKRIAREKLYAAGTLLKNVTITSKKIVRNSKNLNGNGEADQILDDKDMEKAGKLTLNDLLEQKIKGYHESGLWGRSPFGHRILAYYMVDDKLIRFIFDGVDLIKNFSGSLQDYHEYIKTYVDYYTAEDILGIEVMTSARFQGKYGMEYLNPLDYSSVFAFIEITTRSGNGPYMKKTPGTYVYKPMPFAPIKEFYRPRYSVKNKSTGTDTRSTIHWEPNIITDARGCATISFYSADKPGTYTVQLQGTDLNGAVGYLRTNIMVK
jgi:hypothetical protein